MSPLLTPVTVSSVSVTSGNSSSSSGVISKTRSKKSIETHLRF